MAETTWNYTIQDFSPLLQYSGSSNSQGSSSGLNPAWQQSCTGNTATQDGTIVEICDGSSVHTTSLMGATVSLSFYGDLLKFICANGLVFLIVEGRTSYPIFWASDFWHGVQGDHRWVYGRWITVRTSPGVGFRPFTRKPHGEHYGLPVGH